MHPKYMGGLGFRDLKIFNLALLSKQSWRQPDSLGARILKVDYHPTVSLLEVELRSPPSQLWRAILDGRDILA